MTKLSIVYDPKAAKQLNALDATTQQLIANDIDKDMSFFERARRRSQGMRWGAVGLGSFRNVHSEFFSITVRLEFARNKILVLDISHKKLS